MDASYDYGLVALSIAVAMIAAYVSVDLAARVRHAPQKQKVDWLIAGSLVLGIGIWTMHFVGMLALHLPMRLGYELSTTIISILPAIAAAACALYLIQRPSLRAKHKAIGGLIMGTGIGAMHYIGMHAMVMSPPLRYIPSLFAFSVVFAVLGSALVIHLAHRAYDAQEGSTRTRREIISAVVGGLAIAGTHYLGMAATIIQPDSVCLSGFQGPSLPHLYQPWLVTMSITIAVMASYTALDVAGRVQAAWGMLRNLWLIGGGLAMGLGIWSMHFIGMIAMHTDQPVTYDLKITLLSVVPAVAASGFALFIIQRGEMSPRILGLSGLLMGSGIGAMHYIGMAAIDIEPPLRYDATFFTLSLLVAIAASVSALWIGFQHSSGESAHAHGWRKVGSAFIMGLAIAGMHYTGMSATHVLPLSGNDLEAMKGLDPTYIAVLVGIATFMVLLLTYVVAFYDARLAAMREQIALSLGEANEQLQVRANELAEQMTAEVRTAAAKDRLLGSIVEQSSEAIITMDSNYVIQNWNAAAETMFGYNAAEAINQRSDHLYLKGTGAKIDELLSYRPPSEQVHRATGSLVTKTGERKFVSSSVAPHFDADNKQIGTIAMIRDVTREVKSEDALRWQATHDALTELENRRVFESKIELAVNSARSLHEQHAILYLDLDQFKLINDVSGHSAGDQMLCAIAALLQQHIREGDSIARLGGDEFGILLMNLQRHEAISLAELIRVKIEQFRFVASERTFNSTVSIGVVPITQSSQSVTQLMMAADAACYLAKDGGRNRVWVEQPTGSQTALRQREMERVTQLDRAMESNRLLLYCQPVFALQGNNSSAAHIEVLLRMLDDKGALVPPGMFIPAAERYGVMPRIDRWVIENAFLSCAQHYKTAPTSPAMVLAINISATTLSDDSAIDYIAECLARHALPSQVKLCLEITETAAITNLMHVRRFLSEMKKLGCSVSLDDFGSGMSSFAYLKNLPVDYLKIDGSFVKDMIVDKVNYAIVEAAHRVGRIMGIQTVAEYVESAAILDALKAMGIDYGQGYHLARPLKLEDYWHQLSNVL
jgi:diguanylate cyclase (GGDEF)-like protein/PAS domain S-box-containing protein